jgi:fatty-acyl-CoA synthase
VQVPGRDGRAGMAVIVAADNFNLAEFREHLAKRLPDYARPVFLRTRPNIDVTATFKQKKVDLVNQGFDPGAIADPIYFNDPAAKTFVQLDVPLFNRICAGDVRL